jgi:hypothetical protein
MEMILKRWNEMNEKEIRIFPNSQKYEFKTEEELDDYIRNTLRGSDRSGRYNFRRSKSVRNIAVGWKCPKRLHTKNWLTK